MKRPNLRAAVAVGLVCLLAATLAPSAAADDGDIFPYPLETTVLDNGLTVIVVPMSSNGLVSFWTVVRTGSRDEYEPGHSGFAHFFEHMMFRGTERFPQDVYGQMVTEMGADTNAFTTDDFTAYYLNVAAQDLDTVMTIESDRFQNLAYAQPDFKTEAGAVYGEYRKNRTNPFFSLFEAIRGEAFEKHTYGHTTMGYEADIKAMPEMYDYSLQFFDRYYRPENSALLIVGDVEPAAVTEMARRYYGSWEPGYQAPKVETEPEQTEERSVRVDYEGRSLPLLWLGYKVPGFDAGNVSLAAMEMMAELAFGETSDLFQKLTLEEQVVEFVAGQLNTNRDPTLLDIIARVKDPAKIDYVREQIDATIAQYQSRPPDAQRLADLKSRIKYSFLMNLDTPANVAQSLLTFIAMTGRPDVVETQLKTYGEVTPADIQEAARTFLVPSRRTVGILEGES